MTLNISELKSNTSDYDYENSLDNNNNRGTLLTLHAETFYQSALNSNLEPFEELRVLLEEAREERTGFTNNNNTAFASSENSYSENNNDANRITIVGTIAGKLTQDRKFDQCIQVEKWWQKTHSDLLNKGLNVTVVCLHPSSVLDKDQFSQTHHKQAISMLHDATIEPRL